MPTSIYQYSNSVNSYDVLPVLKERVKFLSEDPSASGRYFDDGSFHAMVTEQAYRAVQNKAGINDEDFNLLKEQFRTSVVNRALSLVFDKKEIIEQNLLYHPKSRSQVILPDGDFVGYEINVSSDNNISLKLLKAVLRFDVDTAVHLYMFKQGETEPIWEQTIDAVAGKYEIIDLLDCFISYNKTKCNNFYFGYKPSELLNGARPYADEANEYCTATFYAKSVRTSIPILDDNIQYPTNHMGLNLEVQSFYDYTGMVVTSPEVFDELIGMIGAEIMLEHILFSLRKNTDQRSILESADKFAIQMDLTGVLPITDSPYVEGLRSRINKQVDKVKTAFVKNIYGIVTYD